MVQAGRQDFPCTLFEKVIIRGWFAEVLGHAEIIPVAYLLFLPILSFHIHTTPHKDCHMQKRVEQCKERDGLSTEF